MLTPNAGFVSIACCAEANITDPITNINWTTDSTLLLDGVISCQKISKPVLNQTGYNEARIFNIASGKRCYTLPTTKGEDYLIRGTFLSGATEHSSFGVSVGVTVISLVSSSEDSDVEGLFKASSNHIDFCLVKKEGAPYISQLVLRPLKDLDYLKDFPSSVLKLVKRIDLGGNGTGIRYVS